MARSVLLSAINVLLAATHVGYHDNPFGVINDVDDPPGTDPYAMDLVPKFGDTVRAWVLCQTRNVTIDSPIVR